MDDKWKFFREMDYGQFCLLYSIFWQTTKENILKYS